jgi:BirA family biotin operon repressor/biotin-[acetyl-CoA-carboxylase] ligase
LPQPLHTSHGEPATKTLGLPFIELQSVDSTNNYARQQLHAGLARHGMTFFAHEQLAGKGQRGNSWTAEKGSNILLSMLVKPRPLQLGQQFQLSACVAVATHEFFMKYAGEETKIKWPNDLYWQDRKAGGILIENIVGGQEPRSDQREWTSIIGIGININQTVFDPELKNPVSLKQITGKDFDPVKLAKELSAVLNKRYNQLMDEGFEAVYKTYLTHLYKRKETVKLKKETKVFEAIIEGVSISGKLMVQHSIREEFDFGDVEWVI